MEEGTRVEGTLQEIEPQEGELLGFYVSGEYREAADRLAAVVEEVLAAQTQARRAVMMGALLDYYKAR